MKTGTIVLIGLGSAIVISGTLYYFLVYKKNQPIKAAAKKISIDNKYAQKRAEDAIKHSLKDINKQSYQTVKAKDFFSDEERLAMATENANTIINGITDAVAEGGGKRSGKKAKLGMASGFNFKTRTV